MKQFNNNQNNKISTNTPSQTNPDGTRTETKIETYQNWIQRINKYEHFNNIISIQKIIIIAIIIMIRILIILIAIISTISTTLIFITITIMYKE